MAKVLIVEDVAGLRAHLKQILRTKFSTLMDVIESASGAEGMRLAKTLRPDLIIMDISMPDLNGIRAAKEIWMDQPCMKILFWSQYHREAYVRELGKIVPDEAIHGYALKSESDDKLIFAISSILFQDNPYIDPVVRGVQMRLQSKDRSLTDVEYETLLDIMLGMTDKAIAARRHVSVRGVQNRISMLSSKLLRGQDEFLKDSTGMEILNPRNRLILMALQRGLVDLDEIPILEAEFNDWLNEEYKLAAPGVGAVRAYSA